MCILLFPIDYFEEVLVKETSRTLVGQAHIPMPMGELVRFFGCIFLCHASVGLIEETSFPLILSPY
jgi:hypothetical protein